MLQWVYRIESEWTHDDSNKVTIQAGSGFIINSGTNPYLITNRHVLDPNHVKPLRATLTQITITGFAKNWLPLKVIVKGSPILPNYADNLEEDVAVVSFADHITHSEPFLALNWIQRDYFLEDKEFSAMVELCDLLVIPGYPEYYDRGTTKAIARMGNISSDPSDNYQGPNQGPARRIAFEALSTGGNSGSPVFAISREFTQELNLHAPPSRPAKLIGINAGHFKKPSNGNHEGISYFYRIQVVCDIFKKLGLDIK